MLNHIHNVHTYVNTIHSDVGVQSKSSCRLAVVVVEHTFHRIW